MSIYLVSRNAVVLLWYVSNNTFFYLLQKECTSAVALYCKLAIVIVSTGS